MVWTSLRYGCRSASGAGTTARGVLKKASTVFNPDEAARFVYLLGNCERRCGRLLLWRPALCKCDHEAAQDKDVEGEGDAGDCRNLRNQANELLKGELTRM